MSSETFFKHIEKGDLEKVKEMLPKSGTSGKSGMFGKFKDMFRSGSKIDINKMYKGNTPLIKASDKRHIEIVELLLENGADINAKDKDGATGGQRKDR